MGGSISALRFIEIFPPPSPSIIQNVAAWICGRMVLNESLTLLCISVHASKPCWCTFAAVPSTLLFTHTQTQKPPVFEGTQWGLTSHFTRAGAYQELIPACLRRQTITPSDQSGGATWHLNSSSCSVYIMYIPRQWGRDRVTEGKEINWGGGLKVSNGKHSAERRPT